EIADVARSVGVAGIQLVAQAQFQREVVVDLPAVLAKEGITRGAAVVILNHVVEIGCDRKAEQEIAEGITCKRAIEAESAVVVGAFEAEWAARADKAQIEPEFHRMAAVGSTQVV